MTYSTWYRTRQDRYLSSHDYIRRQNTMVSRKSSQCKILRNIVLRSTRSWTGPKSILDYIGDRTQYDNKSPFCWRVEWALLQRSPLKQSWFSMILSIGHKIYKSPWMSSSVVTRWVLDVQRERKHRCLSAMTILHSVARILYLALPKASISIYYSSQRPSNNAMAIYIVIIVCVSCWYLWLSSSSCSAYHTTYDSVVVEHIRMHVHPP